MAGRNRSLPALVTTGDPAHTQLETNVRNALDQLNGNLGGMTALDVAYTPATAANWASPAPTTVADALDRLVAAMISHGWTAP